MAESSARVAAMDNDKADSETDTQPYQVFRRGNLRLCAALFVAALAFFFALQKHFNINSFGVSANPHFIYQAKSFLEGKWNLDLPASMFDIVRINGRNYIIYPPFPALLLLPFVAIFGLNTSDILFTTVISALNLPLLYLLFEQVRANGFTRRTSRENLIIAVVLFFGSINVWLSLAGDMWFTASIVCLTCTLGALLLAFRRHYALSAVLLGCAFFCRPTAIVGVPFLLFLIWQDAGRQRNVEHFIGSLRARAPDWSSIPWRRAVPAILVLAAVFVLFVARNLAIFGSPLETGYDILIRQRYPWVTDGPFCTCYVKSNIVANFFTFPRVTFFGPYGGAFDRHPHIDMLNRSLAISVFFTTPLFLFLFWRNRTFSLMRVMLWVVIAIVVIAVLLFHASGYAQFGARYLFEGYAYAFLLLALTDARVDWRFVALGLLGILFNYMGADQFWTGHVFIV